MSTNGESNAGFWIMMAILGAIFLFFWREIIIFILEIILGIIKLTQNLVADVVVIGSLVGIGYLIYKFLGMFKK